MLRAQGRFLRGAKCFSSSVPSDVAGGVIVGGGITGASTAFHLAKRGIPALILEKADFTSGATWHAAGLVTYFHGGNNFRFWHEETLALFKEWIAEGEELSLHTPGSLRLVEKGNRDRLDEAYHHLGKAKLYQELFGCHPLEMASASDVARLHPLCDVASIECALYTEGDGHVDPSSATRVYLRKAKQLGQQAVEHCGVTGLERLPSGRWRVEHAQGATTCDFVVNAAGLWARHVGELAGVHTPCVVLQHQYVIFDELPELKRLQKERGQQLPVLRDLAGSYYLRDEKAGMLIGPYEEDCRVAHRSMPQEQNFFLFDGDLERLEPHIEKALALVPALETAGISTVLNGPTCWPADGNHLVGPSATQGFWQACAESYGIAHSCGLGRYLAHWIATGAPPYELKEADPLRFGPWATPEWVSDKVKETYAWNNHVHFPNENGPAGRIPAGFGGYVLPHSGLVECLAARGCELGFHHGSEGPLYFRAPGDKPVWNGLGTFRRPEYLPLVEQEVYAVMQGCGLLYWPFAKFIVEGPQAAAWLDHLVAAPLPKPGRVGLAHVLTHEGKVQGEVTLLNRGDGSFYVVSFPEQEQMDKRLFEHNLPADGSVRVHNVTDAYATLMLHGPLAAEVLSTVAEGAFDDWKMFEWRDVAVGGVACRLLRVSFTGELGWELHCPAQHAVEVFELLAADPRVQHWGGLAMDSLRLEKGIRLFGKDFTQDHSAVEAGLGRFCAKATDFVGRAAVQQELAAGPKRKSVFLEVHGECECVGNEPVYRAGEVVGFTTSGAYGFTVRKSLAVAYVAGALTDLEVELLGRRVPCTVHTAPLVKSWHQRPKDGHIGRALAMPAAGPAQSSPQLHERVAMNVA